MDDRDLFNLLQTADPETLQAMMNAGIIDDRIGLMGGQIQRAQGLANTEQPEAMRVGNTMVARSPLEHIAAALRQGVGTAQTRGLEQQQQGLLGQKAGGREAYLRLLAGQGAPQTPPLPGTGNEGF